MISKAFQIDARWSSFTVELVVRKLEFVHLGHAELFIESNTSLWVLDPLWCISIWTAGISVWHRGIAVYLTGSKSQQKSQHPCKEDMDYA